MEFEEVNKKRGKREFISKLKQYLLEHKGKQVLDSILMDSGGDFSSLRFFDVPLTIDLIHM